MLVMQKYRYVSVSEIVNALLALNTVDDIIFNVGLFVGLLVLVGL